MRLVQPQGLVALVAVARTTLLPQVLATRLLHPLRKAIMAALVELVEPN
jgi:hypothetical protein